VANDTSAITEDPLKKSHWSPNELPLMLYGASEPVRFRYLKRIADYEEGEWRATALRLLTEGFTVEEQNALNAMSKRTPLRRSVSGKLSGRAHHTQKRASGGCHERASCCRLARSAQSAGWATAYAWSTATTTSGTSAFACRCCGARPGRAGQAAS
jgi:hypothetical protein